MYNEDRPNEWIPMNVLHKWSERVNLACRAIGTGRVAARPVHYPSSPFWTATNHRRRKRVGGITVSDLSHPEKRKVGGGKAYDKGLLHACWSNAESKQLIRPETWTETGAHVEFWFARDAFEWKWIVQSKPTGQDSTCVLALESALGEFYVFWLPWKNNFQGLYVATEKVAWETKKPLYAMTKQAILPDWALQSSHVKLILTSKK